MVPLPAIPTSLTPRYGTCGGQRFLKCWLSTRNDKGAYTQSVNSFVNWLFYKAHYSVWLHCSQVDFLKKEVGWFTLMCKLLLSSHWESTASSSITLSSPGQWFFYTIVTPKISPMVSISSRAPRKLDRGIFWVSFLSIMYMHVYRMYFMIQNVLYGHKVGNKLA